MGDLARRNRRAPEPGEFRDPLQDFSAPRWSDGFEKALAGATVRAMQLTPFELCPPTLTVREAIERMAGRDFFCLLVGDDEGRLLGVFTERDVLLKVADRLDEVGNDPIGKWMTANPQTVLETESPAKALNMMAVGGFRHVPVVDVNGRVVGIIGPQRLSRYLLGHLDDPMGGSG